MGRLPPVGPVPCLLWLVAAVTCSMAADAMSSDSLLAGATSLNDWIVNMRRQLHLIPELGWHEHLTAAHIAGVLDELHIPYTQGVAGTGLIGEISGPAADGPVLLLRSDIDALPVEEPEGLPFRSTHPGRFHACGHDGHMAMLLGAAKLLKAQQAALPPGRIKLVFQPFEEGGAGADVMLKTGALDDVQAAFGMHVMPFLQSGVLGVRPGTIMAGALSFHINITGRGGHAAMPHLNVDPIVATSGIISALQTLVSREVSPLGSAVLSVTLIHAGEAYNVIPDTVQFGGTIRALDHDVMMQLQSRVERLTASVAEGYGCNASVDWRLGEQPYYPPTVNDPKLELMTRDVAARLLGSDKVVTVDPIMPAEDFSFYCRKVPCTFAFMGIRNETLGSTHNLHSPQFMLDESVLHKGAAMHAAWAIEYLTRNAGAAHSTGAKDEL